MELTKEKPIIVISGAVIIIALGLYFILYRPVIMKIESAQKNYHASEAELSQVEAELSQARRILASLETKRAKQALIAEGDVPDLIDKLTRQGKQNGVKFIFIDSKQPEESQGLRYKVLPVGMELDSTYKGLEVFLSSLDNLEKGPITVRSFKTVPDKSVRVKLKTKLVLDMYFVVVESTGFKTVPPQSPKKSSHTSWGRNPFSFQRNIEMDVILSGIFWDREKPLAIINGATVGIGDTIEGKTVANITRDSVILSDGTVDFALKIGE